MPYLHKIIKFYEKTGIKACQQTDKVVEYVR